MKNEKVYDSFKMDEFDYLLCRTMLIDCDINNIEKVKRIWSERCYVEKNDVALYYILQQYNEILSRFVKMGYFGMERSMSHIYNYAQEVYNQGLFFENGKNNFGEDRVTDMNEALILGYISYLSYNLTKPMFDNIIIMDTDKVEGIIDYVKNFELYSYMKEYFDEYTPTLEIGFKNYKNDIFVGLFYERCSRTSFSKAHFDNVIKDVVETYHTFIKTEMETQLGTFNQYLFSMLTYSMRLTYENLPEFIKSLESLKHKDKWG